MDLDLRWGNARCSGMGHRSLLEIPGDLRARLEVARLDLLALFRALDRMDLSPAEIPQRLLRLQPLPAPPVFQESAPERI